MKKEKIFSLINALSTPRKAGLLLDLITGKSVKGALLTLEFNDKKASKMWFKLIKSGVGFFDGVDTSNITVSEAYVGPGSLQKSYRFIGRGHVNPIRKRKANLYVKLSTDLKEKLVSDEVKDTNKKLNTKTK